LDFHPLKKANKILYYIKKFREALPLLMTSSFDKSGHREVNDDRVTYCNKLQWEFSLLPFLMSSCQLRESDGIGIFLRPLLFSPRKNPRTEARRRVPYI
jgi:hypothetical protein